MNKAVLTALAGNVVSFSCGTIISWSSPELDKLQSAEDTPFDVPLTKEEGSWVSAFMPLGAIFGPFIYGYLYDKIGRKNTILLLGIPFLLATLTQAFSTIVILFYIARFISGLATGGLFTVMPNYISEISDTHNRGTIGAILNILLTAGMLFSYCVGPYVSITVFNCILAVFPAIFAILFFIIAPESAYYYVQKDRHSDARTALQKVRENGVQIEEELAIIQKKIKEAGNGSFFDIFKSKGLRKAFIMSVGLILCQQFSGVSAVVFYSQQIFSDAGAKLEPALCSIIVAVVMFFTSFLTPLLVDRLGRKILLLVSAVGCILSEAPLGLYSYLKDNGNDVSSISFFPIMCLIIYIITYNFGFGPLPWMVMGELFPTNVKSIAASVSTAICWFLTFSITKYFESIKDAIGMGPCFWIFTGSCCVSVPFIYFVVLETKGKTLHEIQDELEN